MQENNRQASVPKEQIRPHASIQNRLSIVMVLVLVFVIGINFFIFGQINSAVQRIDAVFSSNVTINELADKLEQVQGMVYEYLNTKSSYALENYYRCAQDYQLLLEDLNDKNIDSEIKILEKNIRCMSESYLTRTEATVQAKRGRNVERYRESYEKQTEIYRYINTYIYRLNNLQFRQNSSNYQLLLGCMSVLERVSMVILVIVFVMGLLITIILVRNMIQPLNALSAAAHEVARGNLAVPLLPVVYEDEVGVVTRGFNQMLVSIRDYILRLRNSLETEAQLRERELSMEAHLKEAQLKYLQAQINPHFLFNSLNAGTQLALMEDAENTAVFLEKMADFFRYNVHKMEEDATLLEEIEAVDNYIYILNVRFAGDITYVREMDERLEEIGHIRVPSMILQPIVENAVVHGIHDCMEEGWIRLAVHREDGYLRITVTDNGEGMTPQRIQAVLEGRVHQKHKKERETRQPSPPSGSGVAMDNVLHRLELYYNQRGLLTIESDGPGTGTKVTVLIPLKE